MKVCSCVSWRGGLGIEKLGIKIYSPHLSWYISMNRVTTLSLLYCRRLRQCPWYAGILRGGAITCITSSCRCSGLIIIAKYMLFKRFFMLNFKIW
jgi:hypothetical protein